MEDVDHEDHDHDGWFTRLMDHWAEHEQARSDAMAHRYPRDGTGVVVVLPPDPIRGERSGLTAFLLSVDGLPWRPGFIGANFVPTSPGPHRVEICSRHRYTRPQSWHREFEVDVPEHGRARIDYWFESSRGEPQVRITDA